VAALTEYDPERKGFLVTFKIDEGQQYRVASVDFQTSIGTLDAASMRGFSRVSVGSLYNAEALEKSVEEMQIEASRRGYAFAVVRPRGDRISNSTPSRSSSPSTKARAPTSSASTSAATPAPAIT